MLRRSLFLLLLIAPAALRANSGVTIVEQFVDAYNKHDVDAMLEFVAADVGWMSIAGDSMATEVSGRQQLGQSMREYFSALPSTRSRILAVTRSGAFVHTIEQAIWSSGDEEKSQCSMAVYEISDRLIQNVWYFDSHECSDAD